MNIYVYIYKYKYNCLRTSRASLQASRSVRKLPRLLLTCVCVCVCVCVSTHVEGVLASLAERAEVAEALAHLLVVDVHKAVVNPVVAVLCATSV